MPHASKRARCLWLLCCCAATAAITRLRNYFRHTCLQVFDQINSDSWSSRSALEACIGDQGADAEHPIMDAQLAAQKGDDQTGEGEVRHAVLPSAPSSSRL